MFNEAENIEAAVRTVEEVFRTKLPEYGMEFVITDNASTDSSWKVVQQLAESRPYLRAFRFSRNFGYQNSVFAGLSLCTGDAAVVLDADLEDPPAVIPAFVSKWRDGCEVVYGIRTRRHTPLYKRVLFSVFYRVLTACSPFPIPRDAGDFRLLDRKVLEILKALPERNLYLRGLVTFIGFRQAGVPYERQPRLAGRSKFRFAHYLTFAVDGITAFSKTPLRMIGALGTVLFVCSVLMGMYYAAGALLGRVPVQGFTTLAVLILFLNGVNFIFLAVIGEYLSRIFDDAKFRPRVIILDAIHASEFPRHL